MSHDHGHSKENTSIISFKNSFWLVIILVFLFIGALNFISAEQGGEVEGPRRSKVEDVAAPALEKPAGEIRKETEKPTPAAVPATDSTQAK